MVDSLKPKKIGRHCLPSCTCGGFLKWGIPNSWMGYHEKLYENEWFGQICATAGLPPIHFDRFFPSKPTILVLPPWLGEPPRGISGKQFYCLHVFFLLLPVSEFSSPRWWAWNDGHWIRSRNPSGENLMIFLFFPMKTETIVGKLLFFQLPSTNCPRSTDVYPEQSRRVG